MTLEEQKLHTEVNNTSVLFCCCHQYFTALISISSIPIKWQEKILHAQSFEWLGLFAFQVMGLQCVYSSRTVLYYFSPGFNPPYFSSTFLSVTHKSFITAEENQSRGLWVAVQPETICATLTQTKANTGYQSFNQDFKSKVTRITHKLKVRLVL